MVSHARIDPVCVVVFAVLLEFLQYHGIHAFYVHESTQRIRC